jgi:hypothetical protein
MNAHQLEKAAYLAAHAILTANMTAPELACPGARRSHTIDTIAEIIKSVFELHCAELDGCADWKERPMVHRNEKILPFRAESAAQP